MRTSQFVKAAVGAAQFVVSASAYSSCSADTFADLNFPGGKILSTTAFPITNFSQPASPATALNTFPEDVFISNACGLNITYTHPGLNDTINTWVWLPLAEDWNCRMMGIGGGGWRTGYYWGLAHAVFKGFAAVATDGGHYAPANPSLIEHNTWALTSPGNVDWNLLQDFAGRTVDDAATLGKAAAQLFYGTNVKKSYWNGCSTGGRQGYMIAQRYPAQYDGILAAAPAINWDRLFTGAGFVESYMQTHDSFVPFCELEGFQAAAVAACDDLDGVEDGIIIDPAACPFEAEDAVGQLYNCSTGGSTTLTSKGAAVFSVATSPRYPESGQPLNGRPWSYGLFKGAALWAVANTTCATTNNGTAVNCTASPFPVTPDWLNLYLAKNQSFNFLEMTDEDYDAFFHKAINEYNSIMGTSDPDLTAFKEAGGKLMTWHGLADEIVPPNGTIEYWGRVKELDPDIDDFYRLFVAPGVGHCSPAAGPGWFPGDAMNALIDWVEGGTAPDTLEAKTYDQPKDRAVGLCKWPKRLVYVGGDADVASSYSCA